MREHILGEIRRLAALNGGQAPGSKAFVRDTAIGEHQWRGKFWARWSDALAEAGFAPNKWNERRDSEEVLAGVIAAARHYGRFPTQDEMALLHKSDALIPHPNVVKAHLGHRTEVIAHLAKYSGENDGYDDIAAMLPELPQPSSEPYGNQAKPREGLVYLIKSGDFYKIGRSDDLERRVKEIRIALPDKATLVHSIRTDDPAGIEAYWHRRFAEKRANGEWFKLSSIDVSAFRKRKFQ